MLEMEDMRVQEHLTRNSVRIKSSNQMRDENFRELEDAHRLLKIPQSECPDMSIRPPRHKWQKSWSSMEDPFFPYEKNLFFFGWTIMGKAI